MNALVQTQQAVEILPPGEDVRVILAANPLRPHARKVLSVAPRGTVAEIIDNALVGEEQVASDFLVMLGRHHDDMTTVPHRLWHLVRPKAGTTLIVRALPRFSAIFGAITAAVSAVSAAIAGLGFFGKLLIAGISFAAKLLLNKLFQPKQPEQVKSDAKPSYSISSSRNTVPDISTRLPFVLGKHRVTPYLAALPFTENVGREQYLRMLFCPCYGRVAITDIRIGETAVALFDDCDVETREGTSTVEATALYPTNRQPLEEQLSVELLHDDGEQFRETADDVTVISIDLVWPQGLVWLKDDGSRAQAKATITWRYRLVGTGPWTNAPTLTFLAATQDIIRKTLTRTVPAGKYQVGVFKFTRDIDDEAEGVNVLDMVQWTAIRGFRTGEPITFAKPVAAIAIRIRASSQLNGTLDTLNCIVQSKVTAWNGVAWVANTLSRNPADLMRHVLQGPFNPQPYATAEIDLVALQGWHQYCAQNGWTYDKIITDTVSVWDLVSEICAAGRAMPVFKDGLYSVTWDEQDSLPVQMFTPRNSWGFEAIKVLQDLPHGYRCSFVNAAKGYRQDERLVFDDGYSKATATLYEAFEMPGCTDTALIYKHARFHIAQTRLRPEQVKLNVTLEGIIPTRNDKVLVQHDVPLIGLGSGRVLDVDATLGAQTVTVDEVLTLDPADRYNLRFRLRDGTWLIRNVVAGTSGELQVIPLEDDDDLPEEDDLYAFGPIDEETRAYRVVAIEPQEGERFLFTLVDDAPEIYLADTGDIPDYDGGITEPVDPFELPPSNLVVTDGAYEDGGQYYAYLQVSWTLPRLGKVAEIQVQDREEVFALWNTAATVSPEVTSVRILRINPGLHTVRVRSIFNDGTFSKWNESEVHDANALLNPPDDVTEFRIATQGDTSTLTWAAVTGLSVTYQIRSSPLTTGVTWNTATPLLLSISGTSAQIPTAIGTYLIKAQLPSGVVSTNAALIVASIAALAGLNAVEVLTESPTFPGVKTGVEVISNELRLLANNTLSTWEDLTSVVTLRSGDGDDDTIGLAVSGTYEFFGTVDLVQVFTSRITATVQAYGIDPSSSFMSSWLTLTDVEALDSSDADDWEVTLEYRSSLDTVIWTDWQQFVTGDVTARAFEFRLNLFGRSVTDIDTGAVYSLTTPSVVSLIVNVDMPDRAIGGNDIAVPIAGLTVPFVPPFHSLKGFAINAQDMQTGDYATVTAKDETGFTIIFRNAGGSGVARTFDYNAIGYGEAA